MELPAPKEIADQLLNNAFLTEDQANIIAATLYQPLKQKIDFIERLLSNEGLSNEAVVKLPVNGDVWGSICTFVLNHEDDINHGINDFQDLKPVLDYFSRNC